MQVQPYLFFNGRCEEAAKFYCNNLGAEITAMMRFNEMPEGEDNSMVSPANADKIMHMGLRIGETEIFASDGMCTGDEPQKFEGFSLSISVPSESEAERVFTVLADGGEVQMPLMPSFFSPKFGMLTDRFHVAWIVITQQ
jgi:PhnB protein